MAVVLIADDDARIRRLEDIYLRSEGFETLQAADGTEVLKILETKRVDIIVSDILMPNMDGKMLVRALREANIDIPVLMMTSVSDFSDKKYLFEIGVDDYMTKPVDLEELVLRVRAILRRCDTSKASRLKIGDIVLDKASLEVRMPHRTVMLAQKEFLLLFLLASYPGRIFTRQELMDHIWEPDTDTTSRTVDVHVSRIREKLADMQTLEIVTVRGLGYKVHVKGSSHESGL